MKDYLDNPVLVETVDNIEIWFTPLVEYSSISDSFDDTVHDIKKLIEDVENYNCVWFTAMVTAKVSGIELASDYLGACYYDDYEDFYIKYKDDYYSDMKETVIKQAKEEIKKLTETIKL